MYECVWDRKFSVYYVKLCKGTFFSFYFVFFFFLLIMVQPACSEVGQLGDVFHGSGLLIIQTGEPTRPQQACVACIMFP